MGHPVQSHKDSMSCPQSLQISARTVERRRLRLGHELEIIWGGGCPGWVGTK